MLDAHCHLSFFSNPRQMREAGVALEGAQGMGPEADVESGLACGGAQECPVGFVGTAGGAKGRVCRDAVIASSAAPGFQDGQRLAFCSCTVSPEDYDAAARVFVGNDYVCVGAGLHPWWVPEDEHQAAQAAVAVCERMAKTALVGEVGLDYGKRHAQTAAAQRMAFERIADECGRFGGKVLSIHSVQATQDVLDILKSSHALETCACAFHWFSGSNAHLTQAIRQGCLFSLNPRMLATRRGREYCRTIPLGQVLLETDMPEADGTVGFGLEGCPQTMPGALEWMLQSIAALRNMDPDEVRERLAQTEQHVVALLGMTLR